MRFITSLFLIFAMALSSCTSDSAIESTEQTEKTSLVEEETISATSDDLNLAPPPPVCVFLTQAEVLDLFESGVQIPMSGHRAATSFNSGQYDLTGPGWSGAIIVEMPEEASDRQSIINEVAGAKGKDAIKFGEFPARIMNDGRIISVHAKKPFRVKFSALPTPGNEAPFDAAQRRRYIQDLARAVMDM